MLACDPEQARAASARVLERARVETSSSCSSFLLDLAESMQLLLRGTTRRAGHDPTEDGARGTTRPRTARGARPRTGTGPSLTLPLIRAVQAERDVKTRVVA